MLANAATIIYWNRGDGEKVTGKKGPVRWVPDRGYFLAAKGAPPPFSRRIVFPNRRKPQIGMFTICGYRTLESGYRTLERGSGGLPEWSKGYPDE